MGLKPQRGINCWKETLLLLLHISAIVYNFGKRKFRLDLAPPPALMGPLSSEKLSIILQWTPSDVSLFQRDLNSEPTTLTGQKQGM